MAPLEGGRQAAPSRTQRGRRPATRPARYSPNCNDGTPSHPSTASPYTVAALALPASMAYADIAGLPVTAGLYPLLLPLVVYALLGSAPWLVVGPESTIALLVAAGLAPLAVAGTAEYTTLAAADRTTRSSPWATLLRIWVSQRRHGGPGGRLLAAVDRSAALPAPVPRCASGRGVGHRRLLVTGPRRVQRQRRWTGSGRSAGVRDPPGGRARVGAAGWRRGRYPPGRLLRTSRSPRSS